MLVFNSVFQYVVCCLSFPYKDWFKHKHKVSFSLWSGCGGITHLRKTKQNKKHRFCSPMKAGNSSFSGCCLSLHYNLSFFWVSDSTQIEGTKPQFSEEVLLQMNNKGCYLFRAQNSESSDFSCYMKFKIL